MQAPVGAGSSGRHVADLDDATSSPYLRLDTGVVVSRGVAELDRRRPFPKPAGRVALELQRRLGE